MQNLAEYDDSQNFQDGKFEQVSNTFEVAVGQWYWVKCKERQREGDGYKTIEYERFACCTHVGSNYLKLEEPAEPRYGRRSWRIHFDNFWTDIRYEPDHERVLAEKVAQAQNSSKELMREITNLTQRLGLQTQTGRLGTTAAPSPGSNALVALSGTDNLGEYKTDLIKAKEETLPELFKKLETSNAQVARWMSADVIGLEAVMSPMKASLKEIDGRIFNITLYAGLTESAAKARDGAPADINEPLRVMQTRLYMDEECLVKYEAGGMEFADIHDFDAWLSRDENFYRLFPWPRCAVAFRVRRNEKERRAETIGQAFVNFQRAIDDKKTFLYVRNGEQLWWIEADLDFGHSLFPDQAVFDPSKLKMAKRDHFDRQTIITFDDYEDRCEKAKEAERLHNEWVAANPIDEYKALNRGNSWGYRSPYEGSNHNTWKIKGDDAFNPNDWKPMDQSNVYFDDYMDNLKDQFDQYNRVALIIQGLFDRSMCLHPHHPVQLWNPQSFARSVELIYDGQATLHHGERPDFDAYFKRLNALIDADSVVMGQRRVWGQRESEKAEKRGKTYYNSNLNAGPKAIARMDTWKPRARKAVFKWERQTWQWSRETRDYTTAPCSIEVDADELFNVSAYKPGDFHMFFDDRRTRHEYLRWAPFLLAAEDYHAGKHKS